MSQRILDITTLGATPSLPIVVRLAWERRQADGYHCVPGSWSYNQTTIQLTLTGRGAVWPTGDGMSRSVPVGRALLYASSQHRELAYGLADTSTAWEFLYINLRGAAATGMISDLAKLYDHAAPLSCDEPVIRECLALLPRRGHHHRAWSLAASTGVAQRLLLALSGAAPAQPAEHDTGDALVSLAMTELERRLAEPWTVDRLARVIGVSREHLTRAFIARAGVPPATWLRRRRMVMAAHLLRGGTTVAEIARNCGFPDPAHFARIFKQHTGLNPQRFRNAGSTTGW